MTTQVMLRKKNIQLKAGAVLAFVGVLLCPYQTTEHFRS